MQKLLIILLLLCCGRVEARDKAPIFTPASDSAIRFVGRAAESADGARSFDWSGSYFTFRFKGTECAMRAADTGRNYYNVFVDGRLHGTVTVTGNSCLIPLAQHLSGGEHTVRVQKRTEAEQGRTTLYGIQSPRALLAPPLAPHRHIEFIGDSHTCGYGTEGKSAKEPFTPETENCDLAWGCIIARYFDADYTLIAHSGQGMVRNWGDKKRVSSCTMRERLTRTFDLDSTSRWNFKGYKPDLIVIKLGTNDFSMGVIPSQQEFNASYAQAIGLLRAAYGAVPVLCVAPSDNTLISGYLQALLDEQKDPNLHTATLSCQINNWEGDMGANNHPNHHGHRKMAMAIAPYIATICGWALPMKTVE